MSAITSKKSHYGSAKIVFFDGVCNICNASIDYVMRNSKNNDLKVASLQSEFANQFLSKEKLKLGYETFIYYDGSSFSTASKAVFQVSKELNGFLPRFIRLFRALPRFLTDKVYYLVAKNRYFLAGKRSTCRIPNKNELARFIT